MKCTFLSTCRVVQTSFYSLLGSFLRKSYSDQLDRTAGAPVHAQAAAPAQMNTALHTYKRRAGFTLIEIMIVVAIIALLAAIAIPNFQRARKRTHAVRILEDLRVLEYALDRWAIENNKSAGDPASFNDLRPFLKASTLLYDSGKDMYGREYGPIFIVDKFPMVSAATAEDLSDVAPPEFWHPYQ